MRNFRVYAKQRGSMDWERAANLPAEDVDDAVERAGEWLRVLNLNSDLPFERAELEWSDAIGSHQRIVWGHDEETSPKG